MNYLNPDEQYQMAMLHINEMHQQAEQIRLARVAKKQRPKREILVTLVDHLLHRLANQPKTDALPQKAAASIDTQTLRAIGQL
jgi:hypothetical protein